MLTLIFLIWLFNQPYDAEALYGFIGDDLTLVCALVLDALIIWALVYV